MTTVNLLARGNLDGVARPHDTGKEGLVKSPMDCGVFHPSPLRLRSLSDLWPVLQILKSYRWLLRDCRSGFSNRCPGRRPRSSLYGSFCPLPGVSCSVIGLTKVDHLRECADGIRRKEVPVGIRQRLEALGSAKAPA